MIIRRSCNVGKLDENFIDDEFEESGERGEGREGRTKEREGIWEGKE